MTLTRPEKVRREARVTNARLVDRLSHLVSRRLMPEVRAALDKELPRLARRTIKIYSRVPDEPGWLLLMKTTNRRHHDIFRVIATVRPEYRIRMANRELPVESLIEVKAFKVARVRSARRMMLQELEKRPSVRKLHDEWFKISGGAKRIRVVCAKVAATINRKPVAAKEKVVPTFDPFRKKRSVVLPA